MLLLSLTQTHGLLQHSSDLTSYNSSPPMCFAMEVTFECSTVNLYCRLRYRRCIVCHPTDLYLIHKETKSRKRSICVVVSRPALIQTVKTKNKMKLRTQSICIVVSCPTWIGTRVHSITGRWNTNVPLRPDYVKCAQRTYLCQQTDIQTVMWQHGNSVQFQTCCGTNPKPNFWQYKLINSVCSIIFALICCDNIFHMVNSVTCIVT